MTISVNHNLLGVMVGHHMDERLVTKYGISPIRPYLSKLEKIEVQCGFEFQMCHEFC